jgi:seryl-tRNA synthetase
MAPKSIFRFERSKLTTKTTKTTKEVTLDGTQYDKHTSAATIQNALHEDLPVSASGRTLQAILSLSHPNQLSSYSVDEVKFAWGKTTVKYSRPESSNAVCLHSLRSFSLLTVFQDLSQEVKDLKNEVKDLKNEVKDLKTRIESLEETHGARKIL